jgi:hypothetical protein
MGIFGKKHHFHFGKFAKKMVHGGFAKLGHKISHAVHSGMVIADKVSKGVSKVSGAVAKVATKMSSIPVIGTAAGMIASGARQVNTVARSANKGVKGLEKATSALEGHAKHASNVMMAKSKPIIAPPSVGTAPKLANPLKAREESLF